MLIQSLYYTANTLKGVFAVLFLFKVFSIQLFVECTRRMSIHLNFYVPEVKKQVFFSSCEVFCVLTALMVFQQENAPKSLKRLLKAHTHMYIVKEKVFFQPLSKLTAFTKKIALSPAGDYIQPHIKG